MNKILVPTDFSANSVAGLRFAIKLAAKSNAELVFAHIMHPKRPFDASDAEEEHFAAIRTATEEKARKELEKFIKRVYRQQKQEPQQYSLLLLEGVRPAATLVDYCNKHGDVDYICISTRGAGKMEKLFGSNTGNLITRSPVPVIAVPKNYRVKPLKNVLYATDFKNYEEELKKVTAFAGPLGAKIEVLHFISAYALIPEKKHIEEQAAEDLGYHLKVHFEITDVMRPLATNLKKQVEAVKPSVLILFTNQNRNFFQKLFSPGVSEALSFEASVPLLVFNKQTKK